MGNGLILEAIYRLCFDVIRSAPRRSKWLNSNRYDNFRTENKHNENSYSNNNLWFVRTYCVVLWFSSNLFNTFEMEKESVVLK